MILKYGMYKNQHVSEVPTPYLQFLGREAHNTLKAIEKELKARGAAEEDNFHDYHCDYFESH